MHLSRRVAENAVQFRPAVVEAVNARRAMLVERIEIEFVNEHTFLVVHLAVVADHDPAAKPAGRRLESQVIPNAAAKQAGAINLVLICIIFLGSESSEFKRPVGLFGFWTPNQKKWFIRLDSG